MWSALKAGVVAFVAVLMAGLLVALATLPSSLIGGFVNDSVVDEWLGQTCALVGAPFDTAHERSGGVVFMVQPMPMLALAVPIAAMALAVRWQLPPTEGRRPIVRLSLAAAAVVPFALLMLIPAASGSLVSDRTYELNPHMGTVLGLSALWGLVGGLIGARSILRQCFAELGPTGIRLRQLARPPIAATWGLMIAIAASGAVMWIAIVAQTLREDSGKAGRSPAGAVLENSLYLGEHGVHGVQLGMLTRFERPVLGIETPEQHPFEGGIQTPLPVQSATKVTGEDGGYRLLDYEQAMQPYALVPLLIALVAIPTLLALYSGLVSARAAQARTVATALLWGALTGPVWALALVALNALTAGTDQLSFFGRANALSTLTTTLVLATTLGALGGLLGSTALSTRFRPGRHEPPARALGPRRFLGQRP